MKIDLDLSEIFAEGGENVNESVKDAIIGHVSEKIYSLIENDVHHKIATIIENELHAKVREELDKLIPNLLEYEFVETNRYGMTHPKITVKNRILQDIERQCTYKDGSYDSDKTAYTIALKKIISDQLLKFKPAFDKAVDAGFIDEAYKYAEMKMKERLKIK